MKKISTLMLLLFISIMSSWAQSDDTFKFVDKDGKEVADGSVLTVTTTEDDGWGGVIMKTGLSVKSTKTGTVYGCMNYNIIEMSNGAFQVCFPQNCTQETKVGDYTTPYAEVKTEDIQAEWMPETYGTAKVELQTQTWRYNKITDKWTFIGYGPKVTVNFIYTDPTGITNVETVSKKEAGRYALDGRRLHRSEHGINIIKTEDGKVYKELIK